ncbi:MAG: type 4a pilus biogenesis protein PilO [Nitrospirae bacterium]|nr:type 4a pilus biogenesis protein PilO [Nitrospirota bacterium]
MALTDYLTKLDFSKLTMRERGLAVLTLGAVLFLFLSYFMIPMVRSAKNLTVQRVALKAEIDQGMTQIPLLRKRAEELYNSSQSKEASAEFAGKAGDLFPGGSRLSVLLEEMTRLARLRQIEFVSIRPESVEDKGAYLQLTLQIDVQSRFRELGDYLLMLENLPRAVVVKEVKVETRPDINPSIMAHLKTITYLGKE